MRAKKKKRPSCANQEQETHNHLLLFTKSSFLWQLRCPFLHLSPRPRFCPSLSQAILQVFGEQRGPPWPSNSSRTSRCTLNHSTGLFHHAYPCLMHCRPTGLLLVLKHSELFSTSGPLHILPLPRMLVLLSASMLSPSPASGIMIRNRAWSRLYFGSNPSTIIYQLCEFEWIFKPAVPLFPHL